MKLSANKAKYIKSLHRARYRQKYQNFIVEGAKITDEVLQSDNVAIELIVALPAWVENNQDFLQRFNGQLYESDEKSLKEISLFKTPNQVLIVAKQPDQKLDLEAAQNGLTLFLDRMQDPGNLGTILRLADWFGVANVVRSSGTVELFNPKVLQSSMGAFLRINSPQMEYQELSDLLPDSTSFAAALQGVNLFETDLPHLSLIVIGNESQGVSEEILRLTDNQLSIPKGPKGGAESLNASVATGIIVSAWCNKWN